jgi:DNA-binding IclR family transcriptional regulator
MKQRFAMEKPAVQVLDRALDLIELLSLERSGLGVTELGGRLSLHKSTVHRLLSALAERGYIEKDDGRYRLGLKFVELASLRLNQLELKTEAAPTLRRLASTLNRVAHLAILDGTEAVYIEKLEPQASLRMYSQIGRRIPIHCTALGKSLLSGLSETELDALTARLTFEKFTQATLTTPGQLKDDVARTRRRGWSLDDEEYERGIRCVAVPVLDYTRRVVAAVSVSGPAKVEDRMEEIAYQVQDAAFEISRRMGYAPEGGR